MCWKKRNWNHTMSCLFQCLTIFLPERVCSCARGKIEGKKGHTLQKQSTWSVLTVTLAGTRARQPHEQTRTLEVDTKGTLDTGELLIIASFCVFTSLHMMNKHSQEKHLAWFLSVTPKQRRGIQIHLSISRPWLKAFFKSQCSIMQLDL